MVEADRADVGHNVMLLEAEVSRKIITSSTRTCWLGAMMAAYKGKKSWKLIRIPDPWKDGQVFFWNFRHCCNVKMQPVDSMCQQFWLKRNIYVYLNEPVVYTLSSWPLSSVPAIVKKSLCWTLSRPFNRTRDTFVTVHMTFWDIFCALYACTFCCMIRPIRADNVCRV